MALDDYAALVAAGRNLVPDFQQQQANDINLANARLQNQAAKMAIIKAGIEAQRQASFQADMQAMLTDPSAKNISALMMKYPEQADNIKKGWDVKDAAAKSADFTQLSEIWSALDNGRTDLAAKSARARYDAEVAAGTADDNDKAVVDALESGDPAKIAQVKGMVGMQVQALAGPEHFGSVGDALKGGFTLQPGDVRVDNKNNIIAHSPFIKDAQGSLYDWNSVMGGEKGGADATSIPDSGSPQATVASTLASGGLPGPVVAGFLGNFDVEGGWGGAKGDGGSANGIAQWRADRAANFEKVIGKPIADATHEDQARYVLWEMQHPEDAGMTATQRDAIMNASSPQQAATLIDKYFERSDGKQRQQRVAAALGYANAATGTSSGPKPLLPASQPDQYTVLSPDEIKKRGLDPSQQYQLNTKTGQISSLGKVDAGDQPIPGDMSLHGPAYLATVPQNLATQAKALAEGRLGVISSFALAKPYWQKLLQIATQYDPTFDMNAAPARKAAITAFTGMGKGAQVVGSVNRVANHLNTLWDESQKLAGPETGFSLTNKALAAAGQAFEPADAQSYDAAVGFVAGELEKIARNSPGTEAGVERVVQSLGRQNSKETRNAAIKTAVDIIAGAIDPLKDQYNSAFTNDATRPKIPWVTPKAQKIYSTIGGSHGGVDLSLTGSGADTNSANDNAGHQPPPGATRTATGPNGEKAALVNGRWVRY